MAYIGDCEEDIDKRFCISTKLPVTALLVSFQESALPVTAVRSSLSLRSV